MTGYSTRDIEKHFREHSFADSLSEGFRIFMEDIFENGTVPIGLRFERKFPDKRQTTVRTSSEKKSKLMQIVEDTKGECLSLSMLFNNLVFVMENGYDYDEVWSLKP
jgi:hypothetical protein